MPSRLPSEVRRRLEPIRLVILDVDGVLTDGVLVYSDSGEAMKRFHVRDGLGVRLLLGAGIDVGVISGRASLAVENRCRELGVRGELVVQGSRDKSADMDALEGLTGTTDQQVLFVGDDLPDLPVLRRAGFSACPADAVPEVAAACDLVCRSIGGEGVVREVAELVLKAQGGWMGQVGEWLPGSGDGEISDQG